MSNEIFDLSIAEKARLTAYKMAKDGNTPVEVPKNIDLKFHVPMLHIQIRNALRQHPDSRTQRTEEQGVVRQRNLTLPSTEGIINIEDRILGHLPNNPIYITHEILTETEKVDTHLYVIDENGGFTYIINPKTSTGKKIGDEKIFPKNSTPTPTEEQTKIDAFLKLKSLVHPFLVSTTPSNL